MLGGHITFLFPHSVLIQYVFYTDSTSQMCLDRFRGLGSRVWLMLVVFDSAALSCPRGNTGRKLVNTDSGRRGFVELQPREGETSGSDF